MISELQKKKFLIHFNIYDFDKNGFIEKSDLERALGVIASGMGWATDSPQYHKLHESFVVARWGTLTRYADADNDQKISPEEYIRYLTALLGDTDRYEAEILGSVRKSFKFMDSDGDGSIDLGEYKQLYASLGLDESIAERVCARLTRGASDRISEDEYLQLIDQFFTSQNSDAPGNEFFGPLP